MESTEKNKTYVLFRQDSFSVRGRFEHEFKRVICRQRSPANRDGEGYSVVTLHHL